MDSTEHDSWVLMPKDFKRLTINPERHKLNQWQWHGGEAKFNVNKSSSFKKENMFSEGSKMPLHAVTNWQIFPLNLRWKETQPKKNWNCEWVNTFFFLYCALYKRHSSLSHPVYLISERGAALKIEFQSLEGLKYDVIKRIWSCLKASRRFISALKKVSISYVALRLRMA